MGPRSQTRSHLRSPGGSVPGEASLIITVAVDPWVARNGRDTAARRRPGSSRSWYSSTCQGAGGANARFEPRYCIGHPLDEILIRVAPAVRVI